MLGQAIPSKGAAAYTIVPVSDWTCARPPPASPSLLWLGRSSSAAATMVSEKTGHPRAMQPAAMPAAVCPGLGPAAWRTPWRESGDGRAAPQPGPRAMPGSARGSAAAPSQAAACMGGAASRRQHPGAQGSRHQRAHQHCGDAAPARRPPPRCLPLPACSRSARRRSGSSASTAPAMVPPCVSRSRRSKLASTPSTSAASAARCAAGRGGAGQRAHTGAARLGALHE